MRCAAAAQALGRSCPRAPDRPGRGRPAARPSRPAVRLPRPGVHARAGGAGLPGQGPLLRPRRRRLRGDAGRRDRPRRTALAVAPGGLRRAGARPRGPRGGPDWWPTATPARLADVLRLAVPARHARVEAERCRRRDRCSTGRRQPRPEAWEAEVGGGPGSTGCRGRVPARVWAAPPASTGRPGSPQRGGHPAVRTRQPAAGARRARRGPARRRAHRAARPGPHTSC